MSSNSGPIEARDAAAAAAASKHVHSGSSVQDQVLRATNRFRSHHRAEPVRWNHTLEEWARNWASDCNFAHSVGPYGENIACGFSSATAAVNAWGDEGKDYNYKDPGFSDSTGHFTQLVWQATHQIGCAQVQCGNGQGSAFGAYLVCEYYPPGNVLGWFKQNVKPGRRH